jgi:PIN domain nuclease of toxin-antitoxin system
MKLLLDTHALLWWLTDDPRLAAHAKALIADERNTVLVSAASAWEIATKHRLGRLDLATALLPRFNELIGLDGFQHLPVTYLHAIRAGGYAAEHRDPFDRMLAAQCELEAATLLTCDSAFESFACNTAWN